MFRVTKASMSGWWTLVAAVLVQWPAGLGGYCGLGPDDTSCGRGTVPDGHSPGWGVPTGV